MLERLTFEREVYVPLERETPLVERELPPRSRPSASVIAEFRALDDYIKAKAAKHAVVADVPYRSIVKRDRVWIWYRGDKEPVQFPSQLWKSTAGHYLLAWTPEGKLNAIADLDKGVDLKERPFYDPLLGGSDEVAELRKRARRGVFWVQDTVPDSPPQDRTLPDEFPLHNTPSVSRERAAKMLEGTLNPLIIPYPTSDIIEPNSYRPKPLNFTFYMQDGARALVSRKMLDEEYFYAPAVTQIIDYLKFYPLSQAGKSAMGFVILYQIVGEIGIYFVPVIGPIYGLYQAGKSAHQLITNWDKMGGWEKALAVTDIVFAKFDVIKGARIALQTAKGVKVVKKGTDALVAGGLSLTDAKNLLDAVSVAGTQGIKFKAVLDLAALLRKGERLNAEQLGRVADLYEAMLKRLKPRDRLLAEAVYATTDLSTARKFLLETEITAKQLNGLRLLDPESLVRLREAAKDSKALVAHVADIAASSRDAAVAILHIAPATRPAHFAKVVVSLGDDVLDQIGRGMARIDPKLAAAAAKATTPAKAYRILMDGLPKLRVPGVAEQLWKRARTPAALAPVAARFKKRGMFLNELQLEWFSKLSPRLQDILAAAPESNFWRIANSAENSKALVRYTDDLVQAGVKPDRVLNVLDHVGLRLIGKAEDLGVKLSPDLLKEAARKKDWAAAAQDILQGTAKFEGLLKQMADRLPTRTKLEEAVAKANSARTAGDLTAHWVLKEAKSVQAFRPDKADLWGVAAIARVRPETAREAISKIYRNFDKPDHVLQALGRVVHLHGDPKGLSAMIGDLAAGGDKSAGALFVLDFAANQGRKVTRIEYVVVDSVTRRRRATARKYDLVADGIRYEMKFWSDWSGKKVASAVDEFMRDIVQHAGDFSGLRWVFSSNMKIYEHAIIDSFQAAFKDRWVIGALKKKGIDPATALKNFKEAIGKPEQFLMFR